MRYLSVEIQQSSAERTPMHQFLVDHDEYGSARLLARDQYAPDEHAALFHVEGPEEPYRSVLRERETPVEFELSPCADDSFYLYVRAALSPDDRDFAEAFDQPGLLLVMPVEYRADGTVHVTAVGPAEAVQSTVEEVPETMGVEVLAVGDYLAGRVDDRLSVTQRQLDAVAAAVDLGYYGATREASVADVADRLGCASGTAAELLRRAERTVMSNLVAGGPF